MNVGKAEKVENWRAIQEDARKLQKMCGGRVLPEKELKLKITELHGDDKIKILRLPLVKQECEILTVNFGRSGT